MNAYDRNAHRTNKLFVLLPLIIAIFLLTPLHAHGQQEADGKILIIYHSLTGNTKACCNALQAALGADAIEVQDQIDRSGRWGFFKTAIGSLLGMHTSIEPRNPDLSPYTNLILGSPVWTGKLSMAMRTFIEKNRFDGKKVIIFTTTNAAEQEKYKEKSKDLVRTAGGDVVGYYQIIAQEKINEDEKVNRPVEKLVADTLQYVPQIRQLFATAQ